jgi:exopolysaccharide biosynthesis WecB/TagA/CpsF family protein
MPPRLRFERILAIKLADLGDALLITPALRALRQSFPRARLDVLTTARGAPALARGAAGIEPPLIDEVLVFEKLAYDRPGQTLRPGALLDALRLARTLRARRYDTVVLFHHFTLVYGAIKHAALVLATGARVRAGLDNGRGWFLTHRATDGGFGQHHEVEYWLDVVGAIGAASDDVRLVSPASSADIGYADQLLNQFYAGIPPGTAGPLVAIHPGSGGYSPARRWDQASFAAVANRLAARYQARFVLVGLPGEGAGPIAAAVRAPVLNLEGRTTAGQLAAVLSRCELFIGADSGVMHLAAAAGTPVAAIFGPSNHAAWRPWQPGGKTRVLRAAPLCSPCQYVGHQLGALEGQPARTCMRLVTPELVVRAAEELLGHAPPQPEADAPAAEPGAAEVMLPRSPVVLLPGDTHRMPGSAGGRPFSVLGVEIDPVSYEGALKHIALFIAEGVPRQLVTINPEFIVAAERDPIFRFILNRAALRLPDGQGILWAARRMGQPLAERVTGVDLVERIAAEAAQKGWRLFFLGAAPGVAAQAAAVLATRYPGLQVAGSYAGSPDEKEEEAITARVRAAQAHVLLVAYGAPAQDKWIARNLPRLGTPVCMGVGGAFDFISGRVPRAPASWRRLGVEWLWRLRREPWRWRRMLALPRFALEVLLEG